MAVCSENGNVLFLILIVTALFASLYIAVSHSARSSTNNTNRELAETTTAEILSYTNLITTAIQRMKLAGGIDDMELSFENPGVSGYINTNCTGNRCKVFHPEGGDAYWTLPPDSANDGSPWIFSLDNQVPGVGMSVTSGAAQEAEADLVMILPNVHQSICEALNKKIFGDTTIPQEADSFSTVKFDGTFPGNGEWINDPGDVLFTQMAGCLEGNVSPAAGNYYFYTVIVSR